MFSATGSQQTKLLRTRLKSAAWLTGGVLIANVFALIALGSAAKAAPTIDRMTTASIEPANRLAVMLASPDIGASSAISNHILIFGAMVLALFVMALGSAAFLNGLKRDFAPVLNNDKHR